MRLQQRKLNAETLCEAVSTFEIVEAYPHDKYLPSFLIRAEARGLVFHAHVAADVEGGNVRVVTMYTPNPEEWDNDGRIRRTSR